MTYNFIPLILDRKAWGLPEKKAAKKSAPVKKAAPAKKAATAKAAPTKKAAKKSIKKNK